ncbi:MAG: penicillin acylase family protein [Saprospiraceae bacterium]|nr:penicillin acylase family protein [Saprospiraceae bacterium]
MKIVKFLLSLAAAGGLVYALNTSLNVKGAPLPPLGKFLSPFHGFWQNADPILPIHADLDFPELKNEVKIVYDDRDVPHVFAQNDSDAYFTQGYLHASNRLWQMDMAVRASAGQLSEFLGNRPIRPGFSMLDVDKLARRRGFLRAAEETVEVWKQDAEAFAMLESYCAGINAFIKKQGERALPFEYKFFGVTPSVWTPLKCAVFQKYMAKDLAFGNNDWQATNSKTLLGQADFDFLFPEYYKEQTPVVPAGTPFGFTAEKRQVSSAQNTPLSILSQKTPLDALVDVPNIETETASDPNNGSNNWVVAGSKTANGKPILCGDPHLNLTLPAIWYEMQITTPDMNVYGASLPGTPCIFIGFNDHIAWTVTNVGHDVADWYTIKWQDSTKNAYLLDGKYEKVQLRVEEITVKGVGIVRDTVRYTAWGPIVYPNDTLPQHDMALHWLGNEKPAGGVGRL